MGLEDLGYTLDDLEESMARQERLHPTKAQFLRLGKTSRWIRTEGTVMKGKRFFYRVFTIPSTGTRRTTMANGSNTEFPLPSQFDFAEMSVGFLNLKMFRASTRINEIEDLRTANKQYAVARLVKKAVGEVEADFGKQVNLALHQPGTALMATLGQIYDLDGTSFTGAAGHAPAYIKIKGGAIANFLPNDVLYIYDSADGTTLRATVKVWDVIPGEDGPWSGGTRVADIGPGIICETCGPDGNVADGAVIGDGSPVTWNAVATPDADDPIARSGEYTPTAGSYVNFHGFPDLFDSTVDVFRDASGSTIDREGFGNHWMNPTVIIPTGASEGSEVTFDIDTHMGELEDVLSQTVELSRTLRGKTVPNMSNPEDYLSINGAMLAVSQPDILNDAVRDAADSIRFTTTMSMTLKDAERKEMFGVVGFKGIVYQSASLPPVAFLGDPASQPNKMRLLEPASMFTLTFGGGLNKINWLRQRGGIWTRLEGDTNRTPTFFKQAGAWTSAYMVYDQPKTNAELRWIKSSRK